MSYRNPKIYAPDPTAFSRGFSQGFGTMMQGYARQTERLSAEAKERQRIKAENEKAEAELLSKTDLGGYADLDNRIYDEFQAGIREAIDFDEFSSLSPTEKEKYLFEVRDYKQGFDKFKQILSMPGDQLDARNTELLQLKTAVTENPESVKFKGSGTDMKILYTDTDGNSKEMSVRQLNSIRVIDKTEIQNSLNSFDNDEFEEARKILKEGAKNNKFDNAKNYAEQRYRAQLANSLQNDEYAYIYHNELGGAASEKYTGTPEQKQAVIEHKVQGFNALVEGERELQNILAPEPEEPKVDKPAKWEVDLMELQKQQNKLLQNPITKNMWDQVISARPEKRFDGSATGVSIEDPKYTAVSNLIQQYDFQMMPPIPGSIEGEIGYRVKDNKTGVVVQLFKTDTAEQVMQKLKNAKNISDNNTTLSAQDLINKYSQD